MQFRRKNNSALLKTEQGFVLVNLDKVKAIQPSVVFPYLQKKLLAKSFIVLGVLSTTMNVLKLILISSYSESNAWIHLTIAFFIVQFCSIAFFVVGIRWLKQCGKHREDFPDHSCTVKLVFEDDSVKTLTASDTVSFPHVVFELSRRMESN